jgi:hypothetical protein
MKFRWTMKELEKVTNKNLILALITERQSELNMYCLLNKRLSQLRAWIEKNIQEEES